MGCKPDPQALDEAHQGALDAVERLTGHRFDTCPYAGAYEPWAHIAVEADELGYANMRAAYGRLPGTLVQAAQIIRRARNRRDAEEMRVWREKQENESKRRDSK